MTVAYIEDGNFYIDAPFHLNAALKTAGAKYKPARKMWCLPVSPATYQTLSTLGCRFIQDDQAIISKLDYFSRSWTQFAQCRASIMEGSFTYLEGYPFKLPPHAHQRRALDCMIAAKRLPLFVDCGGGKTAITLFFCQRLKDLRNPEGRRMRALVVGKLMSLRSAWVEDCEKFTNLSCRILWQPPKQATHLGTRELIAEHPLMPGTKATPKSRIVYRNKQTGALIFEMTAKLKKEISCSPKYEKLRHSWRELEDGTKVGNEFLQNVENVNVARESIEAAISQGVTDVDIINHDGARLYADELAKVHYDVVILDESTVIKSPKSKIFKAMCKIAEQTPFRFCLSGTPAPNGPEDLWAQFFWVDGGLTLGASYQEFMDAHFTRVNRRMGNKHFIEYKATKRTIEAVKALTADHQFRIKLRECADLPPLTRRVLDVYMTPEQERAYMQMDEALYTEIDGVAIEAKVALAKLSKLRQITGGFVLTPEGPVELPSNPKLDAVREFVAGLPDDEQVVIFAVFTEEIRAMLRVFGDEATAVYGAVSTADRLDGIDEFRKGAKRIIICQPQSAAHALTLVNARYLLFYSFDYSEELHYQAAKRIERLGQTRAMFIYYFVVRDTIDQIIHKVLERKSKVQEDLLSIKQTRSAEDMIFEEYLRSRGGA